nr:hypothetical protein [Tanacetum cinerariifolium]
MNQGIDNDLGFKENDPSNNMLATNSTSSSHTNLVHQENNNLRHANNVSDTSSQFNTNILNYQPIYTSRTNTTLSSPPIIQDGHDKGQTLSK